MTVEFDIDKLPSPCYVVEEKKLRANLEILKRVKQESGCRILLAQKAFSMFALYPLIRDYLDGTTASGLYEARLGKEEMGKENHVFSAAYAEKDMEEIIGICDHMIFNTISQYSKYKERVLSKGKEIGVRINPECSTQIGHAIYDPCSPGSRLGITREQFDFLQLKDITGLHFHTLCEQDAEDLAITLRAVEEKFSFCFEHLKWINFGGGHHITRPDYRVDLLIDIIRKFREKYKLEVYLEPGEAVALQAGYLVATVLDILDNDGKIAILDTSAACHMPDVLEMPYRPEIVGAGLEHEKAYTYRLGGCTCLAGDMIGNYSFDKPLSVGQRLVFCDMAHYSMVKNNTFNGIPLPAIAVARENGITDVIRQFGYDDFKNRLS